MSGDICRMCDLLTIENYELKADNEQLKKALVECWAEIERLTGLHKAAEAQEWRILQETLADNKQLRDTLEQAVDDFGEGHCVCEQTKQQCISVLAKDTKP